jgi:glycosyltransferase involved in cell wall biosynthesis
MNCEAEQAGAATACWITWERHQRSRSLSAQLEIPLIELSRPGHRTLRYARNSIATLAALIRSPWRTVFVQAPSVVLAHLVIVLSAILRFRVIVDAHNAVIEGAENAPAPLRSLYRFVVRRADTVIVTNSALAERVRRLGGTPGILPDPVPQFEPNIAAGTEANRVVVVSTWAEDEPLEAILQAAELLPQPLFLTITGRPRGKFAQAASRSTRVRLSGFVSDQDYLVLLATAGIVVDLTTRQDCLVCGAYEALALGRPLVVSDSRALRELLQDGALFTANEPDAIARAIIQAWQNEREWAARCAARRDAYATEWRAAAARLMKEIAVERGAQR